MAANNLDATQRQLGITLPNATVLQNPVNLDDVSAVPWPQSPVCHLVSVARLDSYQKGQDILLEALSAPAWRERGWRLRLYGEGRDRAHLEALTRQYGLGGRVEFMGFVEDVRGIWEQEHLLVLPSRAEGTPLALIEAMVCGRPVVATDVGGNAEWVEDGRTGFIAAAPTARSLNHALERAWAARAQWENIGKAARASALAKIDPTPGKTLLKLLQSALASRSGQALLAGPVAHS